MAGLQSAGPCRYFASAGKCIYGDQCNFSHGIPTPVDLPMSAPTAYIPKALRPCRNISLHGFCRFKDKGCEYNHDNIRESYNDDPHKYNNTSEIYQHEIANPYDQRPVRASPGNYPISYDAKDPRKYQNYENDMQYGNPEYNYINYQNEPTGYSPYRPPGNYNKGNLQVYNQPGGGGGGAGGWESPMHESQIAAITQGGTTYFYPSLRDQDVIHQTNYNPPYMYALPHVPDPAGRRSTQSFFINEDFRREFHKRCTAIVSHLDPSDDFNQLPSKVGKYHSLCPLDIMTAEKSVRIYGYVTWVYKCLSSADRLPYALWRVDGFRLMNESALMFVLDRWRTVQHPSVVSLKDLFISSDFGDQSLISVYDFHPCAITLEAAHFNNSREYISEAVLWSYVVQLVSALQAIHSEGLACRVIDASKILLTGTNRIRICGTGILDVINFESDTEQNHVHFQKEDLIALGKLLLCLSCKSKFALNNGQKSLEFVSTNYSPELATLISNLMLMKITSVEEIYTKEFCYRVMRDNAYSLNYVDYLEQEVSKELESGRLFRLLAKLNFINERHEFGAQQRWAETGDRYLLKLFRDYVFHQVYEDGSPAVDLAHVIFCLNKLDAGSPEKLVLVRRSEKTVLVVSYQELKRAIESAFDELQHKAFHY